MDYICNVGVSKEKPVVFEDVPVREVRSCVI